MIEYSIGIPTYQHRFDKWFKPLVKQIKKYRPDVQIMVGVNGEIDGLSNEYRKNILEFCASYSNVLPNVYPEFRALPKIWNNMMINASHHKMLLLNDDISITDVGFFDELEKLNDEESKLCKINGSWSHAIIDRRVMSQLGWFDERLLCIGEEDGDIEWRLGKATGGSMVYQVQLPSIINHVDGDKCLEGIKVANGKYSQFNEQFIYNVKYEVNNDTGEQFGINPRKLICQSPTPPQHLVEPFFWANKHLLRRDNE
jgi:hypothetical protein